MASPFHILGLKQTATLADVKQRYRTLALKYHPDKNHEGHEVFTRIQNAYEVLLEIASEKLPPAELQCRDQLWPEDDEEPSFRQVLGLCQHLRIDAQVGVVGHSGLVRLLKENGRDGYEKYTHIVGMVLSNVQCECLTLEGRCMALNDGLRKQTKMWNERMKEVKELQHELTTLLTSLHVVWDENEDIQRNLRGRGTLDEEEWAEVVAMLKRMAHCQ